MPVIARKMQAVIINRCLLRGKLLAMVMVTTQCVHSYVAGFLLRCQDYLFD